MIPAHAKHEEKLESIIRDSEKARTNHHGTIVMSKHSDKSYACISSSTSLQVGFIHSFTACICNCKTIETEWTCQIQIAQPHRHPFGSRATHMFTIHSTRHHLSNLRDVKYDPNFETIYSVHFVVVIAHCHYHT